LKRELISRQVQYEITELASPTALRRFGAPFKSDVGEVAPVDSELPILRYIFVHHVRNFPFLDQAREKEFWQDRLQVVGLSSKFLCILVDTEVCADARTLLPSSLSRLPIRIYHLRKIVWKRPNDVN
jgi:hypothetical protein